MTTADLGRSDWMQTYTGRTRHPPPRHRPTEHPMTTPEPAGPWSAVRHGTKWTVRRDGRCTPDTPLWIRILYATGRSGDCWLWTRALDTFGYGYLNHNRGGGRRAHRIAYRAWIGPIPDGYELDHLCRVRRCVNPAHLEAVTHTENVRRGNKRQRGTHCRRGHRFDRQSRTQQICRTCNNERDRAKRAGTWVPR